MTEPCTVIAVVREYALHEHLDGVTDTIVSVVLRAEFRSMYMVGY